MQQGTRNPALEHLDALVGEWETEATHPYFSNTVIRGQAMFEGLAGGFFLAVDVVADGEVGRARRLGRQAGVAGDAGPRPERELQAGLQVEEGDGAVLELLADDALRRQAEAVAVEAQRPLQVVDAQGEHGDPRFHGHWLLSQKSRRAPGQSLERNGHAATSRDGARLPR